MQHTMRHIVRFLATLKVLLYWFAYYLLNGGHHPLSQLLHPLTLVCMETIKHHYDH